MLSAFLLAALVSAPSTSLEQGIQALEALEAEVAEPLLRRAKSEGPYNFEDHKRLYENLGIAYAYLDRRVESKKAFLSLLLLDRNHQLSYGLSPKVTQPFEAAREQSENLPQTVIDLKWPRSIPRGAKAIPIHLWLRSDPLNHLKRLRISAKNSTGQTVDVVLDSPGSGVELKAELSALPPGDAHSSLELFFWVTGLDSLGNENYRMGSAQLPEKVTIPYESVPAEWYESWWFWSIVGGAAVAGGATAAVLLLNDGGNTQDVGFVIP